MSDTTGSAAANPPAPAAEKSKSKKPEAARDTMKPLSEARLKLVVASAADVGNLFAAVTPAGTPFADLLEPEFWAQVAYKLRPADEITVHTDDMTYYGRLYVRDTNSPTMARISNRAVVAELQHVQLGPIAKDLRTKTHEAKFLGPHQKWCVVALSDQAVVKDGFPTSEDAQAWMRSRAA